jgi:hypothetical protein
MGSNFCLLRVEEMTFLGLVRHQYLNLIVGSKGNFMRNDTPVFDAMHFSVSVGESFWTGLTGTREAIRRDGYGIDPLSLKFCPHEWINGRGYVDRDLAQDAPRETEILPHGAGGL